MNRKGFTLVELMVTIVIIGLISFLGFPYLMTVINGNEKREFEYYGDAMIAAAKLYIQKEGRDLRRTNTTLNQLKNNQYIIDLNTLINLDYIESYKPSKKGLSCGNDTLVSGVKVKLEESTNTYTYTYQLVCKDSTKNKKYTKLFNKNKFEESVLN